VAGTRGSLEFVGCGRAIVAGVRAVVQRVTRAAVSVAGETVGSIGRGLCVLVGVAPADTVAEAERLADKLWHLRVLDGERSCAEAGAPLLVVSQFTLYADTSRGRRPSWSAAARPEQAEPLVDAVVGRLRLLGAQVETGRFGAHMHVALENDGPVTLVLDVD
jgi:D-tyrosyl-tRNA(Tyr) deacylase